MSKKTANYARVVASLKVSGVILLTFLDEG